MPINITFLSRLREKLSTFSTKQYAFPHDPTLKSSSIESKQLEAN